VCSVKEYEIQNDYAEQNDDWRKKTPESIAMLMTLVELAAGRVTGGV
jgi:hypothetical protein